MGSKKYEEEIYIVRVTRERDREFGDHVTETWLVPTERVFLSPGMSDQFRPYDRPSSTTYDAKTGRVLCEEWTQDGVDGLSRKDRNKPFYVNNGKIKPYRLYGNSEDGTLRAEFPSYVEVDEKTGHLTKIVYDEDSEWMKLGGSDEPDELEP